MTPCPSCDKILSLSESQAEPHSYALIVAQKIFLPPLNELNTMIKHHVRKKSKETPHTHSGTPWCLPLLEQQTKYY